MTQPRTNMKKKLRLSPRLSATTLALLLTVTPAAFAQPARQGSPSPDAATYAKLMEVPLAEAQRRLAIQLRLGEVEAKLASAESFAGLYIEHRPAFAVRALFTDLEAGRELAARFEAEAGTPIETLWAAFSLRRLEQLQEESNQALRAAGVAFDSDLDLRANRVEIMTTEPNATFRVLGEREAAGEPILVTAVAELSRPQQAYALRGGRPLSTCSAGFTARNASGSLGLLTAAHCPDHQLYTDQGQTLLLHSADLSGSRDVQFHHRSCFHYVPNEFDSGIGIRAVTGTRSRDQQVIGSMVCRNGMVTPYSCGVITSKSLCPSYVSSCSSTFVRVSPTGGSALATNGDSGGPVYMPINYAAPVGTVLTTSGNSLNPSLQMGCNGNYIGSPLVHCTTTLSGGRPPFSYTWSYQGDAGNFGYSGFSGQAEYGSSGCFPGAANYFTAIVTDYCGLSAAAYRSADCPTTCPPGMSCPID